MVSVSKPIIQPKVLAWVILVVLGISGFLGIRYWANSWSKGSDLTNAMMGCRNYLEARLVSPSTAKYSDANQTSVELSKWEGSRDNYQNPHFRVIGWVDSQDGFGAIIRTRYT